MAFVGMGDIAPVGMGNIAGQFTKDMKSAGQELSKVGKSLGKSMAPHVTKSAQAIEKAHKDKDRVKGMTSMFSMLGGIALGPVSVIMSLLDKLGVAGPIMDVLNGLMSIFSGTLLKELMPAFQELFDILLAEDTIALIKLLAGLFAMFLVPMIEIFSKILQTMIPIWMNLLNIFRGPLAAILPIIAKALGLLVLSGLMPLIFGIYAVGLAVAALIWLISGFTSSAIEDWNAMMGPSVTSLIDTIPTIISMQSGGYVPATTGGQLINIGEGGEGEHVVPESQMQESVWATENNGKKLDRIYQALVNQGRLR